MFLQSASAWRSGRAPLRQCSHSPNRHSRTRNHTHLYQERSNLPLLCRGNRRARRPRRRVAAEFSGLSGGCSRWLRAPRRLLRHRGSYLLLFRLRLRCARAVGQMITINQFLRRFVFDVLTGRILRWRLCLVLLLWLRALRLGALRWGLRFLRLGGRFRRRLLRM